MRITRRLAVEHVYLFDLFHFILFYYHSYFNVDFFFVVSLFFEFLLEDRAIHVKACFCFYRGGSREV